MKKLTKENILDLISEEQIFERYFGQKVDRRKKYVSPFREDKNPDCTFYRSKSGILYFKDWAANEVYTCFDFVMRVFMCSFPESLRIVNQDFGLHLGYKFQDLNYQAKLQQHKHVSQTVGKQKKKEFIYSVIPWTPETLAYWNQYEIEEDDLIAFNVFNVLSIRNIENKVLRYAELENPIFVYEYPEANCVKFLSPYEKKERKWYGNANEDCIAGISQLQEKANLVFITKSHKDVICLHKAGYPAIAMQGESYSLPDKVKEKLDSVSDVVVILYDNDGPGIKDAKKLSKKTGYPFITLDTEKDFSDLIKEKGIEYAKNELEVKLFEIFES